MDLRQDLQNASAQLSPTMRRASDMILRDLQSIPFQSIRKLSASAGVSPLTVIRLARKWGYEGYTDFQTAVRDWLLADAAAAKATSQGALSADLQAPELQASINDAAAMVNRARSVHITGFRSARAFALYMHYVGRMVFDHFHLMSPSGSGSPEDLAQLTADDVVIAFGTLPYSTETVRLTDAARQLGIPTIAITDSKQSPLATHASISIAVPIARPGRIYRMAPMTAVIDDILEACFDDPVADADRRISYFSARVDSIKGYWK
jgi:DNA-binding MurR/RpiR family transcriptional regulator